MPKGYSDRNQGGWKHKKTSINKMIKNRRGISLNEKNHRWRGENVSYQALHNWIRKHFIKPKICDNCGINPGKDKAGHNKLQWANINKEYLRDRNDWTCLCPSCHKQADLKVRIKHKYGKQETNNRLGC